MSGIARPGATGGLVITFAAAFWLNAEPALAFCVRNDTGSPIRVEALKSTASFATEIANNKKACCQPKDERCAIGDVDVQLSITASEGDGSCALSVQPKGNINVTGKQNALKCKANKAGSTMDWAPG